MHWEKDNQRLLQKQKLCRRPNASFVSRFHLLISDNAWDERHIHFLSHTWHFPLVSCPSYSFGQTPICNNDNNTLAIYPIQGQFPMHCFNFNGDMDPTSRDIYMFNLSIINLVSPPPIRQLEKTLLIFDGKILGKRKEIPEAILIS